MFIFQKATAVVEWNMELGKLKLFGYLVVVRKIQAISESIYSSGNRE